MLSSVDLPAPDGPVIGEPVAAVHREIDVDERVHRRLGAVLPADSLQLQHPRGHCRSWFAGAL